MKAVDVAEDAVAVGEGHAGCPDQSMWLLPSTKPVPGARGRGVAMRQAGGSSRALNQSRIQHPKFGQLQAAKYHAGLENTLDLLSQFPRIGLPSYDLRGGLYRFPFTPHVIFYTHAADHILIVRGGMRGRISSACSEIQRRDCDRTGWRRQPRVRPRTSGSRSRPASAHSAGRRRRTPPRRRRGWRRVEWDRSASAQPFGRSPTLPSGRQPDASLAHCSSQRSRAMRPCMPSMWVSIQWQSDGVHWAIWS